MASPPPLATAQPVGIVQTGGIGDIVIALPIARWFHDLGHPVYWPISERWIDQFRPVAPDIHFLPVTTATTSVEHFYHIPIDILAGLGCQAPLVLYSGLVELPELADQRYARAVPFDQYKYLVAGVPFEQKWQLKLIRNHDREQALARRLDLRAPYIVEHLRGSDWSIRPNLPADWLVDHQVVTIENQSDSIFDWLGVLEGAAKLVMIDSCFANMVEQLGIGRERYFIPHADWLYTPVHRHPWTIVHF